MSSAPVPLSKAPIDCRSQEGIATGLIDGVIAVARVLRKMDLTHPEVAEALKDLRSDEDVLTLTTPSPQIAEVAELPPRKTIREVFEHVGGYWTGDGACPTFGSAEALRIYTVKMQRDAVQEAIATSSRAAGGKDIYQVELDASLGTWMDVAAGEVPTWERKKFKVRVLTTPASAGQAAPVLGAMPKPWRERADFESLPGSRRAAIALHHAEQEISELRLLLAAQPAEGAGQAGQVAKPVHPNSGICAKCGELRKVHTGTCAMMCRTGGVGQTFEPVTERAAAPAEQTSAQVKP